MEFGEKKFISSLGWNFGIQYRVLAGFLAIGFLVPAVLRNDITITGLGLITFSIPILLTRNRLEIDFEKKKIREARYIFGIFVYGSWTQFPDFEYVSVFNAHVKNTFNSRGNQSSLVIAELQVNLVYNKNRRITACIMPNKEKAFATAEYFARKLGGLRRLDATVKPFEWLDE